MHRNARNIYKPYKNFINQGYYGNLMSNSTQLKHEKNVNT